MGKARKDKAKQTKRDSKNAGVGIKRREHSQNGRSNKPAVPVRGPKSDDPRLKPLVKQKVLFRKHDRVLLVGEGDFSFAASLARQNNVAAIVASSFDDETVLEQKYPEVKATLQELQASSLPLRDSSTDENWTETDEWNGFSTDDSTDVAPETGANTPVRPITTVLHGVDATALSKNHKKVLNQHAPFTKIVFNFPHTGGLSTDVNRQVRANQELLVGFFSAAKPYLATQARPAREIIRSSPEDDHYDSQGEEKGDEEAVAALSSGQILVTLFEGEPYTLWNIRDLARHCGLQVIESFKFPWTAYPGYRHARTIGNITTGKDRSDEGKRKGAWRGEEREARTYVLGLKDGVKDKHRNTKKRKRDGEGDSSD